MAQIFSPAADTWFRLALLGGLAVVAGGTVAIVGFARSDYVTSTGFRPSQPIPFSHRHHAGELGIDCRYCHSGVETAPQAGLPPTETCMTCHSQLWTQAPLLAPVRESLATRQPIQWNRVHDLPDFVYFDHSIHLHKGVGCSTCHGRVDRMPLVWKDQTLYMKWCLECHRQPEKFVRPKSELFNMAWSAPDDQIAAGRKLLAQNHIPAWKLSECSVCHR